MYEGDADIDAFERVTHHTGHSLVYNGDITSREKFEMIQDRFPQIQKFMIGRGVLADPFLPARIKGLSWDHSRELEIIKAFHDDLFDTYSEKFFGPVHVTGRMKGFWSYIGPSFKEKSF
jgi:tRNA-dihydrouridine synthase